MILVENILDDYYSERWDRGRWIRISVLHHVFWIHDYFVIDFAIAFFRCSFRIQFGVLVLQYDGDIFFEDVSFNPVTLIIVKPLEFHEYVYIVVLFTNPFERFDKL